MEIMRAWTFSLVMIFEEIHFRCQGVNVGISIFVDDYRLLRNCGRLWDWWRFLWYVPILTLKFSETLQEIVGSST